MIPLMASTLGGSSSAPPHPSLAHPPAMAPPRSPHRLPLYIGIGAAVVVGLLLLGVVLPSGPGGGTTVSGNPESYSGAAGLASSAVGTYGSGGWFLLFAAGIDSAVSYTAPLNLSESGISNCSLVTASGFSGELTLPSYAGNRSAGLAPLWEFAYRNGANEVAIVSVVNGQATVLGTVTGKCTSYFGLLSPVPSGVIGSAQAGATVAPLASSFLEEYPNASALFGLIGGVSFGGVGIGAEWEVEYSSCSLDAPSGTVGAVFNATVNATSGEVLSHSSSAAVSCASSDTTLLAQRGSRAPLETPTAASRFDSEVA